VGKLLQEALKEEFSM